MAVASRKLFSLTSLAINCLTCQADVGLPSGAPKMCQSVALPEITRSLSVRCKQPRTTVLNKNNLTAVVCMWKLATCAGKQPVSLQFHGFWSTRPCRLRSVIREFGESVALPLNIQQGPPNFFVRGPHKLIHNTVREPDFLHNVIVSVKVAFCQINFSLMFFHHWQNGFAGRSLEAPDIQCKPERRSARKRGRCVTAKTFLPSVHKECALLPSTPRR